MTDTDLIREIAEKNRIKANISTDDIGVNYSYREEKRALTANDYWIFKKFPGLVNYLGSPIRSYNESIVNKPNESNFTHNYNSYNSNM